MSKRKVSIEDKIYAVNLYLDGRESQHRQAMDLKMIFAKNTESVQKYQVSYQQARNYTIKYESSVQ